MRVSTALAAVAPYGCGLPLLPLQKDHFLEGTLELFAPVLRLQAPPGPTAKNFAIALSSRLASVYPPLLMGNF